MKNVATDILESSFSFKKITNKHFNLSLFCIIFYSKYPFRIEYSAFVLQCMYSRYVEYLRVFVYFICYLYLRMCLNANIGSFMLE